MDRTGVDRVPITDRTRLLSDNGKLERYHQTLKRDVNQLPYELPADLE